MVYLNSKKNWGEGIKETKLLNKQTPRHKLIPSQVNYATAVVGAVRKNNKNFELISQYSKVSHEAFLEREAQIFKQKLVSLVFQ